MAKNISRMLFYHFQKTHCFDMSYLRSLFVIYFAFVFLEFSRFISELLGALSIVHGKRSLIEKSEKPSYLINRSGIRGLPRLIRSQETHKFNVALQHRHLFLESLSFFENLFWFDRFRPTNTMKDDLGYDCNKANTEEMSYERLFELFDNYLYRSNRHITEPVFIGRQCKDADNEQRRSNRTDYAIRRRFRRGTQWIFDVRNYS